MPESECSDANFQSGGSAAPCRSSCGALVALLCHVLLPVQPESHRALEISKIFLIIAHGFFRDVRELCNGTAIDILQLDDNIQRFLAGIIGAEGSNAEGHLCSVLKIVIELLRAVKVQTVTEQQLLCPGIHAVFPIVRQNLFAPFIGVAAMA